MTFYDDVERWRKGDRRRRIQYVAGKVVFTILETIAILVIILAILWLGGWLINWFGWTV